MPQEPQVEHPLQLCLRHVCYRRYPQFHPPWQLPCFRDSGFSVFAGSAVYLECVWWWFKLCSACMQPFHQQSTGHESMLVACSQHQRKCLAIIVCRLIHHVGQTAITAEPTMQRVKLWMWPVSFQHTACLESPCNCHTDCKSFQPQSMS